MTKGIEIVENTAYDTKSQVSLHTLTIVYQLDLFTCFCSHQTTTGDKGIEIFTNLAYANSPGTLRQTNN